MKKERYEGTLSYLIRTNETFLMVSTFIFLASLFAGYLFSGAVGGLLNPLMDEFRRSIAEGELKLTTASIFLHNLQAALLIYGGGLLLGVFTALFLFVNGLFIGFFASKVPLGDFFLLTMPHGVFEIPGLIIAGAAGFRLASFTYHFLGDVITETWYGSLTERMLHFYSEHSDELKDSLMLLGIGIVFLIVAAFVEANLTLGIYTYIKGIV
ncbi:MAG TPA: stage II sporulation protein M [Methanothermobacter thermautotrophicus]|uniref:Stage II sporulation protein M n=1 Tax=Methanothermobacter thermautotrophicus TaxID=145262 RepID=A0A7J4MTR1_METTF|nr:stage II sporulation protein M [Methanothermobacter thermautotrophicus]